MKHSTDWVKVVEFGLLGIALMVSGCYIAYKCNFTGIISTAALIVVVIGLLFTLFFVGSLISLVPLPWWVAATVCFAVDLLNAHCADCPEWEYADTFKSFVDSIGGESAVFVLFFAGVMFASAAIGQHERRKWAKEAGEK